MNKETEDEIIFASMKYISSLFKIPIDSIDKCYSFGKELKANKNSFSEDEFDDLIFDIEYVSDNDTLNKFRSNQIKINTVDDFCNHMIKCYKFNRRAVRRVLKLKLGKRRFFLFHLRRILNKGVNRRFFYLIKSIFCKKK